MSSAEQTDHAAIAALKVGDTVVLEYEFRQIVPILRASPKPPKSLKDSTEASVHGGGVGN
jgi:hypothetical protein